MAELAGSVLGKLSSIVHYDISLPSGVKEDLMKLDITTKMLRSVLDDAEERQLYNKMLKVWLDGVKDVFNDAVDVLDEVECEALRRRIVKEYGSVCRKVRRFFSSANPFAFDFRIARKVKDIRERLDEIAKDKYRFQLSVHKEQSLVIHNITTSFVDALVIVGRDIDKARIIELLLLQDDPNSDDNLSVIPIVGFGGLGKTLLAKLVYNDERVRAEFDLRVWVSVPVEFDVTLIVRNILKWTKHEEDTSEMSTDQLQFSLRSTLQGKKLLLVLDDVWNENQDKWLHLRYLFSVGAKGSKVIVTTRSNKVASIMTRTEPHHLKGLSEEDSLSLFFKCAFRNEIQAVQNPKLNDVGKEIVSKCGGVPLALKVLGSLLYSKPEAYWIHLRETEIWELEQEGGQLLPVLQLSYHAMPPCLKQCFAYCSTFTKDARMKSFELIAIWMALGFLQSVNEEMELEDIGQLQFKELCALGFFQCDDDITHCTYAYNCNMHPLIHDLACSISRSDCCIIKSGMENFPDSVRHLRIFFNGNHPRVLKKFEKLRSIHIHSTEMGYEIDELLSTCIMQSRYLRVFDLHESSFKVLPSLIGTLKQLRYLNLSENWNIERLPDSICTLQSLQTLLLEGCHALEELPRDISQLVSLRTLSVTTKQVYFPENGIGQLKSLRTLIIAMCMNLRSLPLDLRSCCTLRTLVLQDCEKLDLATMPDEIVIRASLQSLIISNLPMMTALPHWIEGASHTLKLLDIVKCDKLIVLPEYLSNLISLQKLVIRECTELLCLPDGMERLTSLAHLEIEYCKQLQLASGHDGSLLQLNLQTVIIRDLPKATGLPNWLRGVPGSLQHLEIQNCPQLEIVFMSSCTNDDTLIPSWAD